MKLKKFTSQGIAALLSLSLLTAGVMIPSSYASAAKIKLNKTKLKLTVGSTYQLKINKKKVKVKWTSSKKKIASVNSKGKVKAKKVGTAVISATVKGKKYKCKVTVKKAKNTKPATTQKANTNTAAKTPTTRPGTVATTPSPTPFVIPTPIPTNTPSQPAISENPNITPGPTATREPIDLDQLSKNISLQAEILANNILITVTNHNTIWVDDVTVNYDLYDTDENNIATGYAVLNSMQPEETMYVTVPSSDIITAIDETASTLYSEVSEAYENTKYTDLKDSIEFTAEEFTEQDSTLFLDVKNHSKYDANVCYTVFFYDANQQIVDAYASTMNLTAKDQVTESIDVPLSEKDDTISTLVTDYKIVYSAHGTEEITELTPYIENITLTPEKTQNTLLVAVKNNNTGWLSSLSLEYHLYDTADSYLMSEEQSLLSMKPGETQYITINTDPDIIQAIDLERSYAEILLEPDNGEYKYNTTTMVKASVTAKTEENSFEITITNDSTHDTEGSYIIYFYDSSKKLIGAQQYNYTLMSRDSETIETAGPISYNEDDIPIYTASVQILASHTL